MPVSIIVEVVGDNRNRFPYLLEGFANFSRELVIDEAVLSEAVPSKLGPKLKRVAQLLILCCERIAELEVTERASKPKRSIPKRRLEVVR